MNEEWKTEGPVGFNGPETSPEWDPVFPCGPTEVIRVGPDDFPNVNFRAGDDVLLLTKDAIHINGEPVTEIGEKGLDIIRKALIRLSA